MGKTSDKGASTRSTANSPRKRANQTPLSGRVAKLEQLVKAGMNEKLAAKIVGMTEDEVRDALRIPANTELTNEVFVTALTKRVAKNRSGAEKANERASKLERRLSAIEELLGNDNAAAALRAGQDGGRKSFIQALRDRKVSDDDIRKVLVIVTDGDLDLTDDQLFYELYSAHALLCSRVDTLSTEVSEVRQIVEDIDDNGRISLLGFLTALLVGIIVWFIFWLNPYGATGPLTDSGGKTIGSASMGWHAGGLGVGMGIMAAGIVLWIAGRSGNRRRTTTSTQSSSSSSSGTSSTSVRQRIVNIRSRNRAQDNDQPDAPSADGDDNEDTRTSEPAVASTSS